MPSFGFIEVPFLSVAAAGELGKITAAHVISRPHSDLLSLLPK
jgi:microcompartment protein CcmL/EutN